MTTVTTNTKAPGMVLREDLYRQVWEAPMEKLAATYGVSDRGLAKICQRNRIKAAMDKADWQHRVPTRGTHTKVADVA